MFIPRMSLRADSLQNMAAKPLNKFWMVWEEAGAIRAGSKRGK